MRWRWLLLPWWMALGGIFACTEDNTDEVPAMRAESAAPTPLAPIPRVETTDVWLDLVSQRPTAHIHRDRRLVVDLGRQAARSHVTLGQRSPWRLGRMVDDRRAGVVEGLTASLELPIDGLLAANLVRPIGRAAEPSSKLAQAETADRTPAGGRKPAKPPASSGLALAVTVKPLVDGQSMTVLWNERPLAHLPLSTGWQRRTVTLPADLVRAGDNRLRLHFRRAAENGESGAVRYVEVGTEADIVDGPPAELDRSPYVLEARGVDKSALRVTAGTSLVYYLLPPRRGRLRLSVSGRGSLTVAVSDDADHEHGRPPRELLQEPLRPTGATHELDLSPWGNRPLRLEVFVGGSTDDAEAVFDQLRVVQRRPLPVDRRQRKPREVVIIGIEGARGDSVFVPNERLPNLTRIAEEGLVFTHARAVAGWAVPNHAAWLSSVPPPVHQTIRGTFVADRQTTLPEVLSRAGWFTAIVSANADVDGERGLLQGFAVHAALTGTSDDHDALAVLRKLRALLEGRPQPRMFYANVNDPQAPYDPPREFLKQVEVPVPAPLPHLTHVWVGRIRVGRHKPGKNELAYVKRLYEGELQVVDQAVGGIIDDLERAGRLDASVVVVLGLHGEEFFEHGGAGHGHTLYEESIHVPLAIRAPELIAPGRVDAAVDLLDLSPTIADLLGLPFPDEWHGDTLVPLIDDPEPPHRLVMAYLGDGARAGVIGEYKLVLAAGNAQQFFDLRLDPQENEDLADRGGLALRMLRSTMAWHLEHERAWRRARWGTAANLRPAFALDHGL